MSTHPPAAPARRQLPRRLAQLAALGLAGLLAGLLTGCSSSAAVRLFNPPVDTDWQTSSTYASATAALPPSSATRTARVRPCYGAPCELRPTIAHNHPSQHRTM